MVVVALELLDAAVVVLLTLDVLKVKVVVLVAEEVVMFVVVTSEALDAELTVEKTLVVEVDVEEELARVEFVLVVVMLELFVVFATSKSATIEPPEFSCAIVLATVMFAMDIPLLLFHETKSYPLNAVALIESGAVELYHNVPDGDVQPSTVGET